MRRDCLDVCIKSLEINIRIRGRFQIEENKPLETLKDRNRPVISGDLPPGKKLDVLRISTEFAQGLQILIGKLLSLLCEQLKY
jgi:hypothetical protein